MNAMSSSAGSLAGCTFFFVMNKWVLSLMEQKSDVLEILVRYMVRFGFFRFSFQI